MNCECNNKSNRVKPGIKHVYGNVLRMAIPLTLRTLVKDGDEIVATDTDFIPSADHAVRVVFSKGKTNYPIVATMDGNVAIIEDRGKIPVGTYDISVECYDDLGNPYRFKQNAVLYVADTTAEAGIDEDIEYEAQTWYLNAAVFLATTEIGEIGDVIDTKLEDVFGNAVYDANAKEIRFYNKDNSRLLATIDSRPFIVDGTVADVYIDVSRQVLVVVLNEDAGGRRFSVPLYLVFSSYYKKDEVDSLVSRKVEGVRFDFSQELPLVVPVTKNGSSISSSIDYWTIDNAIREDGRLVVACVNNGKFYQLLNANGMEVVFSRVVALDGYQELLIVNESNVWSMEDVELGTGGGGGGYEPPAGGIPKSDLAQSVQDTLDAVDGKVDKESGKSLMTDAEHTKLAGIAAGAEVNVQSDWTQTTTTADDYIKNKPTLATVATSGSYNDLQDKPTIPTVPTNVSAFTNDAGYTTNTGTITGITMNGASKGTSGVVDLGTVITAHQDISGKANASDVYTKTQADTLLSGKQDTLTFDNAPTSGSNNPVKSGGIKTALDAKANTADVPTKTEMADAIDDALGEAEVTVVPANSVGIITSLGSDSNEDALSASMGKKLKIAILQIYSSLGAYAFPNGKPNLDFDEIITYSVDKTIGTGLSATGGDTDVEMGDTLEVAIAITNNLYIIDDDSVVVTMGGQPVAGAWNAGTMKVTIGTVTGNVVINVPSMTYVDVDGSNNQLAFFLDCKNRGGQTGHWIDLIGNKDFTLTNVTAADDGMVFNGSTSKGVASGSLDVYYYNNTYGSATIEAVVDMSSFTPATNQRLPILSNTLGGRVAAMFRTTGAGTQMITCSTNSTGVDDPNNNFGFFFNKSNKSFGTTGGTDGGIVVVDGNVPENPRTNLTPGQEADVHDFWAGLSSVCAVGYRNFDSTDCYFKGKILAIRVYKTKLTTQQIIYNHNIDKKRFNLA